MNVAQLIARCLENEGVEFVFGLPGEEIIHLLAALDDSPLRFILARSEQGAAFMAEMYGRVTGKAGVCLATLGPGAINLLLGVADAQTDSTPLVALSAQVGLGRIYKETHQVVDLVGLFKPVTKWADTLLTPGATPEMIRHAFQHRPDRAARRRLSGHTPGRGSAGGRTCTAAPARASGAGRGP